MSTKIMFGCLLMVFTVGSVSACETQADCPDTHCCAKKAFVEGEYNCVPFRQKHEMCLPGGLDEVMFDGRYDINCPCQPGLMCQQFDISDGIGGFNPEANPTCRDVIEDRELLRRQKQNQLHNSAASADANGQNVYANSGSGQNSYASAASERRRK